MAKLIIRIVCLLLVPCLVMDPITVMGSLGPVGAGHCPRPQSEFGFTSQALSPISAVVQPGDQSPNHLSSAPEKLAEQATAIAGFTPAVPAEGFGRQSLIPLPDGVERWVSPLESLGWAWLSWRSTRTALGAMGYGTTIHEAPDLFTAVAIYIALSGVLTTIVNWALHRFLYWLFRREPPKLTLWGKGLGDRSALIPVWFLSAATAAAIVFVFSELAEHSMTPYQWLCLNAWTYYAWGLGQIASVFGSAHTLLHYLHNLTHGPGYRWSLIPTGPADTVRSKPLSDLPGHYRTHILEVDSQARRANVLRLLSASALPAGQATAAIASLESWTQDYPKDETVPSVKRLADLLRQAGQLPHESWNREMRVILPSTILVIAPDGSVRGYFRLGETSEGECDLPWFAVRPDERGKGIGTEMLAAGVQIKLDEGLKSIRIERPVGFTNALPQLVPGVAPDDFGDVWLDQKQAALLVRNEAAQINRRVEALAKGGEWSDDAPPAALETVNEPIAAAAGGLAPAELTQGSLPNIGEGLVKIVYGSSHWVVKRTRSLREGTALVWVWYLIRFCLFLSPTRYRERLYRFFNRPSLLIHALHSALYLAMIFLPSWLWAGTRLVRPWQQQYQDDVRGEEIARERLRNSDLIARRIVFAPTRLPLQGWPWRMMAASAEERAECSLIQKLETLATLGQFDEIEIWLNRFIEFRRRAWSEGVFSADPHLKNYGVIGKRIVLLDFGGLTMDLKVVEDHLQETNGHRRPDQRLRLEKILEKRPDIAGRFNANWDNLMQLSVVRDAWQNGAGQKSHAAPPTAPATFTILNHPLEPEDIQKASPAIAYLEALQTNFDLQATSMRASLDSGQNISDGISALIALTFDKALMQQREAIGGNFFLIVGNLLNPISIALQEAQEVMMGKKTVPSELRGYLLKQLSAFATSLTRAIQTYHHAAAALGSAA